MQGNVNEKNSRDHRQTSCPRAVNKTRIGLACEQALLFGRASLARSRETRFARPNRRVCSQARIGLLGSDRTPDRISSAVHRP